MKFKVLETFSDGDMPRITSAIISVDPDAKVAADVRENTVDIDSWLFAEEFVVAFRDAGYDVRIAQR
ncbi:MAG: copper chaperone [Paraburkholderia sp.]|jgi:copper chaperone CopZ|nr:copper chaperone [Paraburkholderia sp.]